MLALVVWRRRRGRGGGRGGAGQVWTVYEMACFLSLLEVDVDPAVIMPRQVLAALGLHGGATDSVLRRRGGRQVQFLDKVVDVPVVMPTKAVEELHLFLA